MQRSDVEIICNHMLSKVVSCEVDFNDQVIYLEFDDGSLVEISGDDLDIYMEFQDFND